MENKTVRIILKDFKKEYLKAVEKRENSFKYKDIVFVTNYAKYLIEYVESKKEEEFSVTTAGDSSEEDI